MDVSVCPSISVLKKSLGIFGELKSVANKRGILKKQNTLN